MAERERELRTDEYPYAWYPDHWGPFPIHDIFPIEKSQRPLDVDSFQICIPTPRGPCPIFVGFDDFVEGWPQERELTEKATARRDRLRNSAIFRALVTVKKLKQLTPGGIEILRNAGADVSEAACQEEALVVAVTGKYSNYPIYSPDNPKAQGFVFIQYIHDIPEPSGNRQVERNLHIASWDVRSWARSLLYFERIKLRRTMYSIDKQYRDTKPVNERSVEWFIQKCMEKYPTAPISTRKPQVYRGARKHTSEYTHVFVCHAEYLLLYAKVSAGSTRIIDHSVLKRWAEDAPAKRDGAARTGRQGWGKWERPWVHPEDNAEFFKKQKKQLRHFIEQIQREEESGNEAEDEDDEEYDDRDGRDDRGDDGHGDYDGRDDYDEDMLPIPLQREEERSTSVLTKDGKVKGANYARTGFSEADEDDGGDCGGSDAPSLDEPPSAKRPRSSVSTTQRSEWSSRGRSTTTTLPTSSQSGWKGQQSSPSLGGTPSSMSLGDPGPSTRARAGPSRQPGTSSLRGSQAGPSTSLPSITKQVEFIVLSSDSDVEILEDQEMRDAGKDISPLPPPIKREPSIASRTRLSNPRVTVNGHSDEEIIPDSEAESEPCSSDSASKYNRRTLRPGIKRELSERERIAQLNERILKFAPSIRKIQTPRSWTPWNCECPPLDVSFNTEPHIAHRTKCKFLVDLRKPSEEALQLLSKGSQPMDGELLKHLKTKPSPLNLPWDELSTEILARLIELHWEEHYAAWGVKKVTHQATGNWQFERIEN